MEKNKINKKLLVIIIGIIIILIGFVFVISFFGSKEVGEKVPEKVDNNASYPQDYTLKDEEIPETFELENLDQAEMSRIGLKSNPGFIYNVEYFSYLYSGVNPSKVGKLYTSTYKNKNTDNELGVMAIKYKTSEDLSGEREKITKDKNNRKIYLRRGAVLIIIWCDNKDDIQYINNISGKIKERLSLSDL